MGAKGKEHYIGVDLGGTKILAGVFNSSLKLKSTSKQKTLAQDGCKAVLDRLAATTEDAIALAKIDRATIAGVAIGAPGTVDTEKGTVRDATHLGWESVPLIREMERRLNLPVWADNDCNLATLGVYHVELRAKPKHMVGIFIGTGIGGGIIINGQLHRGINFAAGEFGHMILNEDLVDGENPYAGSFESLAGGYAWERIVRAAQKTGAKATLKNKHSELAIESARETARIISIAVGNVISILAPERVVLGGGVIGALHEIMMPIIRKQVGDRMLPSSLEGVRITTSKLAEIAGITGAAWLARGRSGRNPIKPARRI